MLPASKIKARRGTKVSPVKGGDLIEENALAKSLDKHVNESRTKSVKGLHNNRIQSPGKTLHNESVVNINNNNSPGAQSIQRQYEEYLKKERMSLSPFTKNTNITVKTQLNKLDDMEYQKTRQERQGLNQNCADLLFKTNREIKSLNYKLMRVVTTDDNFHTLLTPNRMNDIEVIE